MSYILYRKSTVGATLEETLDQFAQGGAISDTLAKTVMNQFDKTINQALPTRVKNRLTFKSGRLRAYRFCDNVWTFILQDVEFREMQDIIKVEKVKIVACDGKGSQAARETED